MIKAMRVLTGKNIRLITDKVNKFNEEFPDTPIQNEDIVDIIKGEGQYLLVYFN